MGVQGVVAGAGKNVMPWLCHCMPVMPLERLARMKTGVGGRFFTSAKVSNIMIYIIP